MKKSSVWRFGLGSLVFAVGATYALMPSSAPGIDDVADRYAFSIARWEIQQLWRLAPMIAPGEDAASAAGARSTLTAQTVQVLKEQGITTSIAGGPGFVFPPVEFTLGELPLLLVVSPRERIELHKTVLLEPSLNEGEMLRTEEDVERLGFSALVERIGGVALYPSLIPADQSRYTTLTTIAHEWFHHYLFFKPLGRGYGDSYQMTSINEMAADMVGREVGRLVYERYYGEPSLTAVRAPKRAGDFDFQQEMRTTRLAVDRYLQEGRVMEADNYKEQRRTYMAQNGYQIRKLNQAYFAFHGSYAQGGA
ncbi:MAG: hypothetical protein HYX95_02700, partial [Chloroflexi bacterium]|nr:hypothetical protein [Chloroflexota bacterium]